MVSRERDHWKKEITYVLVPFIARFPHYLSEQGIFYFHFVLGRTYYVPILFTPKCVGFCLNARWYLFLFNFLFSLNWISDMDLPFRHIYRMCLPVSLSFWYLHSGLVGFHECKRSYLDCIFDSEFPCRAFLDDRLYRCVWLADIGVTGVWMELQQDFQ